VRWLTPLILVIAQAKQVRQIYKRPWQGRVRPLNSFCWNGLTVMSGLALERMMCSSHPVRSAVHILRIITGTYAAAYSLDPNYLRWCFIALLNVAACPGLGETLRKQLLRRNKGNRPQPGIHCHIL